MSVVLSSCPGCGLETAELEGPVHAYVLSSPGCWRLFGQAQTLPVERLFVDAYMVQHPGGTEARQTQSVAVHLIVLDAVLRLSRPVDHASGIASAGVELGRRRGGYPKLSEPEAWELTVADVVNSPASSRTYIQSVLDKWLEEEPESLKEWTDAALRIAYT